METDEVVLTFEDGPTALLEGLVTRFDGRRCLDDLASELKASAGQAAMVLQPLWNEGLLLDLAAALNAETVDEFVASYFEECRFWNRELFAQPFWEKLLGGEASREAVLGWGVEFYHYVEAANEHMAMSVASSRPRGRVTRLLAEHYVEEYDHARYFLKGLEESGLDAGAVIDAPPLPATRGLINFLTELAAADTIAYTGAFGIMQANKDAEKQDIQRFFDFLVDSYPYAAPMFEGFREHAILDLELEHQTILLEKIIRATDLVNGPARARILSAARDTFEHFVLFFECIDDYYSQPGALVPRRPVDIRAVL
ncbi:MAG: iron-containing redox enzyme family protein [Actinomycetota bacterium]|nr:iron-containing redox enzyme family protein [Actinomycetota bacterium]